jgi:hypothetical protein
MGRSTGAEMTARTTEESGHFPQTLTKSSGNARLDWQPSGTQDTLLLTAYCLPRLAAEFPPLAKR